MHDYWEGVYDELKEHLQGRLGSYKACTCAANSVIITNHVKDETAWDHLT